MACLMARPVVDGLKKDWESRVQFFPVDGRSHRGREVSRHFGIEDLPTLLLFDGGGQLQGRGATSLPPRSEIESHLVEVLSQQYKARPSDKG